MRALLAIALFAALPLFGDLSLGAVVPEGEEMAVVADVNGDGLTDLIQDVDVLVNQGSGNFVTKSLGMAGTDRVLDWIDVNGDGLADLLTRDYPPNSGGSPSRLTYRIYLAAPGLKWTRGPIIPTDGSAPHIAEMNGDGKEDVVLARQIFVGNQSTGTELQVMLSNGDGTFTHRSTTRIAPHPQYGIYQRLLAADLNHDGHRDLVFRTAYELIVVPGTGGGSLGPPDTRYLAIELGHWYTELGDVDGDGNLDVLLASVRSVRVFYGDGRGRFPRMTTTPIARTREARVPPHLVLPTIPGVPPLTPETILQPRNFALGRFVQEGRFELAVGTGEGDVVVFAYDKGTLVEVDRIETEFLSAGVHAGNFLEGGGTDLYATYNYGYIAGRPAPRLLYGDPAPAPDTPPVRRAARTRAIRGSAGIPSVFDVHMSGECVDVSETWTLAGEGIFGRVQIEDRVIETAMADGLLFVRFTAPSWGWPAYGALKVTGSRYEGTSEIMTPCGWKHVTITATPR